MVGFVVGGCFANKQNPAGFHLSFKLSLRVLKIVKTNRRIYSSQSQNTPSRNFRVDLKDPVKL